MDRSRPRWGASFRDIPPTRIVERATAGVPRSPDPARLMAEIGDGGLPKGGEIPLTRLGSASGPATAGGIAPPRGGRGKESGTRREDTG